MNFDITKEQACAMTQVSTTIYKSCVAAGWYTDISTGEPKIRNEGEQLMLIVTEVAEAMEGSRKGLMDDHLPHRTMMEVELADCMIRIFDLCGSKGFDIGRTILEKVAYNQVRADHKLENRMKPGGKAV